MPSLVLCHALDGPSLCAQGRRATLLASGVARAIASDDRAVYWTDAVDSGAFLNVVTSAANSRFPADSPAISFIPPHVASVADIRTGVFWTTPVGGVEALWR